MPKTPNKPASDKEQNTDWRAGCGRSASPVLRGERLKPMSRSYLYPASPVGWSEFMRGCIRKSFHFESSRHPILFPTADSRLNWISGRALHLTEKKPVRWREILPKFTGLGGMPQPAFLTPREGRNASAHAHVVSLD
jgi:hypothetical protein